MVRNNLANRKSLKIIEVLFFFHSLAMQSLRNKLSVKLSGLKYRKYNRSFVEPKKKITFDWNFKLTFDENSFSLEKLPMMTNNKFHSDSYLFKPKDSVTLEHPVSFIVHQRLEKEYLDFEEYKNFVMQDILGSGGKNIHNPIKNGQIPSKVYNEGRQPPGDDRPSASTTLNNLPLDIAGIGVKILKFGELLIGVYKGLEVEYEREMASFGGVRFWSFGVYRKRTAIVFSFQSPINNPLLFEECRQSFLPVFSTLQLIDVERDQQL